MIQYVNVKMRKDTLTRLRAYEKQNKLPENVSSTVEWLLGIASKVQPLERWAKEVGRKVGIDYPA